MIMGWNNYLYLSKRVEDGNIFLVECLMYTHIIFQFQNIYYDTYLPNMLTHHNYGDLGILVLKTNYHINCWESNPLG